MSLKGSFQGPFSGWEVPGLGKLGSPRRSRCKRRGGVWGFRYLGFKGLGFGLRGLGIGFRFRGSVIGG